MTENRKVAVIVLAAGKGTRMKSDLPKVMMPLCGKPMIRHIIETLEAMNVDKIVPVVVAIFLRAVAKAGIGFNIFQHILQQNFFGNIGSFP